MSTVVTRQDAPHDRRPKLSIGNGCNWLSAAVREFLHRARERRELAGMDEAQLRELRQMAKRAGTAL